MPPSKARSGGAGIFFPGPLKLPALVLAAALAVPGEQLLQREAANRWAARSGGTVSGAGITTLRIETRGAVVFQGDGGSSLGYQTKRSVEARSPDEATQMLAAAEPIRLIRRGDELVLSLRTAAGRVATDVRVQPPRGLQRIIVETDFGPVEVRDTRAEVSVVSGGGPVLCDRIGGAVRVHTAGGDLVLGDLGGEVRAATGTGVVRLRRAAGPGWLRSGAGEIVVDEVAGALVAMTGAGSIDVGRAGGSVQARTRGGLIRVGQAGGEVLAESEGGTIQIGSAPAGVRCESAAGTVKLNAVAGEMHVVAAAGNILAQLHEGLPLFSSLLSAARGDITVWIPSNLAVTVAAIAESPRSRIVSEFPEIRVDGTGGAVPAGFASRARGSLNGGGPVLRVAAGDGVVYLRRHQQ